MGHGPDGVLHPAGKVYLSPVIDCYDGMPVPGRSARARTPSWPTGCSATRAPRSGTGSVRSSTADRGCHYRWPGWISICRENGLTRSMSAKGCSPDNAAAEGFFGHLKQEFFHGRSFTGVTIEGFVEQLDGVHALVSGRAIKLAFGTSIAKRRRELGLMA